MPSRAYADAIAAAAAHHATSKTYSGKFLRPHKPFITRLVRRLGIESALDYGAGKGAQYSWIDPADGLTLEQAWGLEVAKFDPAWPPFAAEHEGQFDLVLCTHVLGSIPVVDLDWFFGRVFGFATKAVYFAEKIGPIKKTALADVDGLPAGWTPAQWLAAVKPFAKTFGGETHFSFRTRADSGEVSVERHRYKGGRWTKTSNRT